MIKPHHFDSYLNNILLSVNNNQAKGVDDLDSEDNGRISIKTYCYNNYITQKSIGISCYGLSCLSINPNLKSLFQFLIFKS